MQKKTLIPLSVFIALSILTACTNVQMNTIPAQTSAVQSVSKSDPIKPPTHKKMNEKNNIQMATADQKRTIPIFMYHSIAKVPGNNLCIPPEIFDMHIKKIIDYGFQPITASEYLHCMETNTPLPKNPILLTFDDGYEDNYKNAFPILKKYKVKGTIFPITNAVNTRNYLTTDQIKEMSASGLVDFGSHTANHNYLSKEDTAKVLYELRESKKFLERVTGNPIRTFCYPFGDNSPSVIKQVEEIGYSIAFSTEEGGANYIEQQYLLHRYYITPKTPLTFLTHYIQ